MQATGVGEQLGAVLPHVNAGLNSLSFVLLVLGRLAIRAGDRLLHKRLMLAAFTTSAVFLISYLARFALTGTHRFGGTGAVKALYLAILFSHMALAAVTPFLAVRAIQLGLAGRWTEHVRVVRWAFPIWLYVSVTGVIVYAMLYHL